MIRVGLTSTGRRCYLLMARIVGLLGRGVAPGRVARLRVVGRSVHGDTHVLDSHTGQAQKRGDTKHLNRCRAVRAYTALGARTRRVDCLTWQVALGHKHFVTRRNDCKKPNYLHLTCAIYTAPTALRTYTPFT